MLCYAMLSCPVLSYPILWYPQPILIEILVLALILVLILILSYPSYPILPCLPVYLHNMLLYLYIHINVYRHICQICTERMYVCMYACMHACMHVCMYVCMYVCMCVCLALSLSLYPYVYIYGLYVHVCVDDGFEKELASCLAEPPRCIRCSKVRADPKQPCPPSKVE